MIRPYQSSFRVFDVLTTDGIIKEIKPASNIASIQIMNCGNTDLYIWTHVKIEPGASQEFVADQNAFLSLSKINVHFNTTGVTSPAPKLVVIAEKVTDTFKLK